MPHPTPAPPAHTTGGTPEAGRLTELARRAAEGDHTATREFFDAVKPAMKRAVVGVLGASNAELDDVIQQALIEVSQALGAFRGECHPAGYASRIAFHVALRAQRRAHLDRERIGQLARLSEEPLLAPSPSDLAGHERRRRTLRDLLATLPEEQAIALGLRVVLGIPLDEVARTTGVPINTVRSRVRLAKEALRRRIEADPALAENLEDDA